MRYPIVAMRLRPLPLLPAAAALGGALTLGSCAGSGAAGAAAGASSGSASAGSDDITTVQHVDRVTPPPMALAGARCSDGHCSCRGSEDEPEKTPPAPGQKRLELRLTADGGQATLESPTVGRVAVAGPREACFYLDVPAGSTQSFTFSAVADRPERGVGPRLTVAEYGPKGPYWYKTLAVTCAGANARCDREGAEAWGRGLSTRKRGRIDPCGSMVVTGLKWDTSGSEAGRDGGFFRDFVVRFELEAKKFPTQFAPGSTECVPK
jgi:hypothetical protein